MQKVGFTVITVEYERPAARGRKIFGELVPYDKIWRTGAGNCTKIKFTKPVEIDNKKVDAGTYSLFTIPNPNEWTVIFNKDTTLYGTERYDEKKDAVRLKTKSETTNRHYESFTIDIDVVSNNAELFFSWEKSQIHFKIETESDKKTTEFIDENLLTGKSNDADQYARAAEYYFYLNKELNKALTLLDKAIVLKQEPWFYRLKVDILEKQKKYSEGINVLNWVIDNIQTIAQKANWSSGTLKSELQIYQARIEILKKNLAK